MPTNVLFTVRLTDEWVPLPAAILTALGWREGQLLTVEVVTGPDADPGPITLLVTATE